MPGQPLDGELWLGRGSFDQISAIVRRQTPDNAEWRGVRYMVFDLSDAPRSFSERVEQIKVVVAAAKTPWLQAVPQFRLPNAEALQKKLRDILRNAGDGLMLHRADAAYETGRSGTLLKLTPWLDAEATVIAHLPGKGKYAGMTGAPQMVLVQHPFCKFVTCWFCEAVPAAAMRARSARRAEDGTASRRDPGRQHPQAISSGHS